MGSSFQAARRSTERSRSSSQAPGRAARARWMERHAGWWRSCSANQAAGEAAVKAMLSSEMATRAPRAPKSCSTKSCSPQRGGAGGGVGEGGERGAMALHRRRPASAIAPSLTQLVITTRPPGRTTRSSSEATRSASGAKMAAKTETARSKRASSAGMAPASPWAQERVRPSRSARSRATCSRRAAGSTAVTSAPRRAAARAALPVPQPMSSTRSPGRGRATSMTRAVAGSRVSAVFS